MTHRLYCCTDDGDPWEGQVCVLVWAKNERYARKSLAVAIYREGGDYDPDSPANNVEDVTDKIPTELHRARSGHEGRGIVERLAGWGSEGDKQCENCELYEMGGKYPVCEDCCLCSECGCECEPTEDKS